MKIREFKKEIQKYQKAIRLHCLECVCYQPEEVKLCPSINCPFYLYREIGKVTRIEVQAYITKLEEKR